MPKQKQTTVVQEVDEPDISLDPIEGGTELRSKAQAIAEDMRVQDYKGVGTSLSHGHDRSKHDGRKELGITDELAENYLFFDPADHAFPHELLARKDEFLDGDVEIFKDTEDTDSNRWAQVKRAAAPVSDETHRKLDKIASHEL